MKATYYATITAPAELTVLMSALRKGKMMVNKGGKMSQVFKFEQKIPIPSYLIAIAVGDIVSKKIGPRSHVWSEAAVLEKALGHMCYCTSIHSEYIFRLLTTSPPQTLC